MTDAIDSSIEIAGYRLGDSIELCDLLSLPPDGRRYARDGQGRLSFVSPDSPQRHRHPLVHLQLHLARCLLPPWYPAIEPGVGFELVYHLQGHTVGESRLGHKKLEPDLAVWEEAPDFRPDPRGDSYSPQGLRLIVEFLSPGTWRTDLGRGSSDNVDRWRTYLEAGVSEYWVLNATPERLGLSPHSGLFLVNRDGAWQPLPGEDLEHGTEEIHGHLAVRAGRIRSTIPDLTFDLAPFWSDVAAIGHE